MAHRFVSHSRWLFILLIILVLSGGIPTCTHSEPYNSLHAMPPHPKLVEKWMEEGAPDHNFSSRLANGIDHPRIVNNPPKGNFNLLVVLVDFSDQAATVAPSAFNSLVFGPVGSGSVLDYFDEISYGNLTFVTVNPPSTLGWVRATLPYNGPTGYINADGIPGTLDDWGFGPYPQNLQGLAWDMLNLIDSQVDFSQYDNNGDGIVDGITFAHAGPGAEITGSPSDIWSSAWDLTSPVYTSPTTPVPGPGPYQTNDGVLVDNFAFDPEYMIMPGDQTVGVFCHELGHTLFGLPDLYDYDNSSNGIGMWSLMSYGSWNGPANDGSSPAWPDAWSRLLMGFDTPVVGAGNAIGVFFQPVEYNNLYATRIYRINSPSLGSQEYFLVENRFQSGFDQYIPGNGLLIWHVDEEKWNAWEGNQYECSVNLDCSCPIYHTMVTLEQADGLLDLETATDYGDAGDPYPGSSSNLSFTYGANPESGSWLAQPCPANSCVSVTNIQNMAPNIQADVNVVCTGSVSCVSLLVDQHEGYGKSTSQVDYGVALQNCSSYYDFFTLSSQSTWPVIFFDPVSGAQLPNPYIVAGSGGAGWKIGVRILVPSNAKWGDFDPVILTAQATTGAQAMDAIVTHVAQCVLVVDDDRSSPEVEFTYFQAINSYNLPFDYWDVDTTGQIYENILQGHEAVIWFNGSGMPKYDTLNSREEATLSNYLTNGGNLFLSSQDYLWDAGRTDFNRCYLRTGSYFADTMTIDVTGVAGNPVGNGLGPFPLNPPSQYSDIVQPAGGAQSAFTNQNGASNAVTYDSGVWKSLFLAWPLEYLIQPEANQVMAAALSWFELPQTPLANFIYSPLFPSVGETVVFSSTSLFGADFDWDFGDGFSGSGDLTTHSYTVEGTYTVTLIVENDCGEAQIQQVITVLPACAPPSEADFTWAPSQPLVDETVMFSATVGGGTEPFTYTWNFGDGAAGAGQYTSHNFMDIGTFTVTLVAANECGQDTVGHLIEVFIPPGPEINVDPTSFNVTLYQDGTQVDHLTVRNLGEEPLTFDTAEEIAWLTLVPATGGELAYGESLVYTVTFDAAGLDPLDYSGAITITSNDENEAEINIPITMHVIPPAPEIEVTPLLFEASLLPGQPWSDILSVANLGNADLLYTLTDDAGWLTVTPTSGLVIPGGEDNLLLVIDTTGMLTGTYTATITIESNDNDEMDIQVQAVMTLLPTPAEPFLYVSPAALNATLLPDQSEDRSITIFNLGGMTLTWEISSTISWLVTTPASGQIGSLSSVVLGATIDTSGLDPAEYLRSFWILSDGGNVEVKVTLIVAEPPVPPIYKAYLPVILKNYLKP